MSQEESKTMPMQIFPGVKEVYYGICASTEFTSLPYQLTKNRSSYVFVLVIIGGK